MKNTFIPLLLGLVAVVVAFWSVRERNATQRDLQAARHSARAAAVRADTLDVENDALRKQLASAPKVPPIVSQSVAIPTAAIPAGAGTAAFSLVGTVRLTFGSVAVGGGWKLREGRRGFVFATPSMDESGSVMLLARLVEMPDSEVARFGLQELLTDGRAAERLLVRPVNDRVVLMRALEESQGLDVLTPPRVLTRPGGDATIQVQGNPELGEQGFRIGFTPNVQPDGASLDLGIKVRFQPDEGKPGP